MNLYDSVVIFFPMMAENAIFCVILQPKNSDYERKTNTEIPTPAGQEQQSGVVSCQQGRIPGCAGRL
jgi:hypothetical protein